MNCSEKSLPPRAFFIGFGDSSLDFRLLAWVDIEDKLDTESDLNVSINARLKEAGIEIPFPQRDLHIRSDATKSDATKSGGTKSDATKPEATKPEATGNDASGPDDTDSGPPKRPPTTGSYM